MIKQFVQKKFFPKGGLLCCYSAFSEYLSACEFDIFQAYNPEDDEGEDVKVVHPKTDQHYHHHPQYHHHHHHHHHHHVKVVHPKTDEQRTRLQERVQSQLLFRTLDQDQLIEVGDCDGDDDGDGDGDGDGDQDQLIEVGAQLIIKSSVMQLSKVPD